MSHRLLFVSVIGILSFVGVCWYWFSIQQIPATYAYRCDDGTEITISNHTENQILFTPNVPRGLDLHQATLFKKPVENGTGFVGDRIVLMHSGKGDQITVGTESSVLLCAPKVPGEEFAF